MDEPPPTKHITHPHGLNWKERPLGKGWKVTHSTGAADKGGLKAAVDFEK